MTNRFKRTLALLSLGGVTFAFLGGIGGGCAPFLQAGNAPYVNFLVDSGKAGIGIGVDGAFANVPKEFSDWFKTPVTTLYQSIWTGYIKQLYAQDPVFSTLLTQ